MMRLSLLMYHLVEEPKSPEERRYAVSPHRFGSHMQSLRENGYRAVSLEDVEQHLQGNAQLPDKPVAVTFDDGYLNNYTNAFPILQEHAIPATLFLVVAAVGGRTTHWMQTPQSTPHALVGWEQIHEMRRANITFGSHTLDHPRLSQLDRDAARVQIRGSKSALEDALGTRVHYFAYPYGDFNDTTLELVREAGYALACTTRPGFNQQDTDPLLLRRLEVRGEDSARTLLRKLRFGTNDGSFGFLLSYYGMRLRERLRLSQPIAGAGPLSR